MTHVLVVPALRQHKDDILPLFAAFLIVVANFIVDLVYGFIDPRVKAGV